MNTDTQVTEEAVVTPDRDVASSFNAELEAVGIDPKTGEARNGSIEDANDVALNGTQKPKQSEQVPPDKKDGIPDDILLGKPKAEKVDEIDPFTAEPPPELKGKSREHFKNLQVQSGQKITHLEAERAKLAAEIAELKKSGTIPEGITKELEQLRKEKDEINAELEILAVERSPKFKQKFVAREQSLKAQAIRALKISGADETLFDQAIAASEKRKFEILNSDELNEAQRSTLSSLLVQYDLIQDEKNSELSRSKEYVTELERERTAARDAELKEREAQETQLFETVGKRVSSEFEPFMEVEGNEAWNAQVRENREQAKRFFAGKASMEELAEIAHYGIGAKSLHKMFKTLQGKYNELVATHGKVVASNPSVNGGHQPKETPKNESVEERRMRSFREELSAVQNQG